MKYVYEFIGTFILMLTVGMTLLGPNDAGLLAPLAIGGALAVMVFAGGHISGGHYNPAVSLAVFLRKKLSFKQLWEYWIVQFTASVIAVCFTVYLKDSATVTPILFHPLKAFIAEFIFTFALCYVVLNVATVKATEKNSYFGWAIGLTVLVGAYAVGPISGAAFNPAVALGISLLHLSHWSNIWIYLIANLLGGCAAAWVVNVAHPKE